MDNSWNYLDKPEPTFLEWLKEVYDTYPLQLWIICKNTASRGARKEYNILMRWYRHRYETEMEKRRAMAASCPFTGNNSQQQ